MIGAEYYKGQRCVHGALFCQEGFCSECEIHTRWTVDSEKATQRYNEPLQPYLAERELELVGQHR